MTARFYGWTHDYMMEMGVSDFNTYFNCIEVIQSQERLMGFTNSDWPNLKKEQRKDIHKQLSKIAYPNKNKRKFDFSPEGLRGLINGE